MEEGELPDIGYPHGDGEENKENAIPEEALVVCDCVPHGEAILDTP